MVATVCTLWAGRLLPGQLYLLCTQACKTLEGGRQGPSFSREEREAPQSLPQSAVRPEGTRAGVGGRHAWGTDLGPLPTTGDCGSEVRPHLLGEDPSWWDVEESGHQNGGVPVLGQSLTPTQVPMVSTGSQAHPYKSHQLAGARGAECPGVCGPRFHECCWKIGGSGYGSSGGQAWPGLPDLPCTVVAVLLQRQLLVPQLAQRRCWHVTLCLPRSRCHPQPT